MAISAVGGAIYTLFPSEPMPTLTTRGPTMPWFVSQEDCLSPAYERSLWDYDWGDSKRGLKLCFLALKNGEIPYAVAPTPPEEIERLKKEKEAELAEIKASVARGEPPKIQLRVDAPWFFTAPEYSELVQDHIEKSIAELNLTPQLRQKLEEARSPARWLAKINAFKDAFPWVAGFCFCIWVLTAVVGWIVRGFAGVPAGRDFRELSK